MAHGPRQQPNSLTAESGICAHASVIAKGNDARKKSTAVDMRGMGVDVCCSEGWELYLSIASKTPQTRNIWKWSRQAIPQNLTTTAAANWQLVPGAFRRAALLQAKVLRKGNLGGVNRINWPELVDKLLDGCPSRVPPCRANSNSKGQLKLWLLGCSDEGLNPQIRMTCTEEQCTSRTT